MKKFLINYILIPAMLTGCSIGPKYAPTPVSVPSSWSVPGKPDATTASKDAWWHHFHDPLLNELIEQQSVYNLNIQAAQARVESARAEYAAVAGQLFPMVGVTGMPPTGTGVKINQLIALTTSIDPDLFGKIRQNKQRAQANLKAEEADRDFAFNDLYAEIASSYLELRENQAKTNAILHNVLSNKQTLQLIKSRYKAGYSNYLSVTQQEGLIETQLADLQLNKALVIALIHKIELLTGNNPGALAKKLAPPKPIPKIITEINLGIPSELLLRRADIIAAEKRVQAAHANIRVAMANLVPQVTIGWLLGWQTQTLSSNLFAIQNPDSSLFGTFAAPVFNVSLYRMIDVRKREKVIAILNYQLTVMKALHDVEIQYNYCQYYKNSSKHLKRALDKKQLVLKLSKDTYQKGLSNFDTVLRSEEELNHAELAYLQNIVLLQKAKINLYKALGGGVSKNYISDK